VKISLEWVGDYVDLPDGLSPTELARELTLKTVEVEDITDPGAALANVVAGVIETAAPFGDRGRSLVACRVADDTVIPVVSDQAALTPGTLVAVALPGAELSVETGRPLTVSAVTIEGRRSEGIICSPASLGLQRLFADQQADVVLDLRETRAIVGMPLVEVLGYNDAILEVDNKSLTNRPDLWGHYGIAREFATIYDLTLRPLDSVALPGPATARLIGHVDSDVCQRFTAVEFTINSGAGKAPLWLRSRLARIDQATVSLCVDLSNYVMFTTGQPTHAYDADKVTLPLSAARAKSQRKLKLLDGTTVGVTDGTPVIEDAAGAVALAGIMGGADSAVSSETRHYVLEAATFRAQPVRLASQRLGVRTEASARYEKSLDTQRVDVAVGLFWHLLRSSGADSEVIAGQDMTLAETQPAQVSVRHDFLAVRIGVPLDHKEITQTLSALGFSQLDDGQVLHLSAPTWRSTGDISRKEDIVEEVARIHGYDALPTSELTITLRSARSRQTRPVDRVVRETLASRAGLREVVTYPWVSDAMLAAVGMTREGTVRFDGAPSPEHDTLRRSLIPNLLEAAARNVRYGDSVRIFEVGTVFPGGPLVPFGDGFEPMPVQRQMLAGVLTGADGLLLFRQAKGILDDLTRSGQLTPVSFAPAVRRVAGVPASWADVSARAIITVGDGTPTGTLGLLGTRARRLAHMGDVQAACFELDLGHLARHTSRDNKFEPLPDLPEADFDLSVVVPDSTPWDQVSQVARRADPLVHRVTFSGEFRGAWVPDNHRSLTLRITLRPTNATLTAQVIGGSRARVLNALAEQVGARLRS
jgi:phenylalanyl-tRNA synthetase beta chain